MMVVVVVMMMMMVIVFCSERIAMTFISTTHPLLTSPFHARLR